MHGIIHEFEQLPRVVTAAADARPPRATGAGGASAPLIGIVRNPRSHRNKGHEPEFAGRPNILTETPRTRSALRETLAGFAARDVDYLAVDGGDGTVRDVLTCGAGIFGDDWPALIVLPKGKTNALAVDLGLPNVWSLAEALDAVERGGTIERRPLVVELPHAEGEPPAQVRGFIFGAGVYTLCVQAGQEAHRRGAFNAFAVLLSILWGLLQTFFGTDRAPWRRGTAMQIGLDAGRRSLPHGPHGDPGERFLLFASTLERFPLGAKPFGARRAGLKLVVLDRPLRRALALVPLFATGFDPAWAGRIGVHRDSGDPVDLELGDRFILDGEAFPAGTYVLREGAALRFVVP